MGSASPKGFILRGLTFDNNSSILEYTLRIYLWGILSTTLSLTIQTQETSRAQSETIEIILSAIFLAPIIETLLICIFVFFLENFIKRKSVAWIIALLAALAHLLRRDYSPLETLLSLVLFIYVFFGFTTIYITLKKKLNWGTSFVIVSAIHSSYNIICLVYGTVLLSVIPQL